MGVARSAAVGCVAGVGPRLVAALELGAAVPGGIRIWPRRSDTRADAEADETGEGVAMVRGVIAGLGVAAATDAADCAGAVVADGAEVVAAPATGGIACPPPLTNCLGGAFGGGVASDWIFWRVFFASS